MVQRQLPLDNGAALRVTIARYYTPSGRLIQRPYEDGNDLAYYRELYSENRESKIDSLKLLRPKYKTKSGRKFIDEFTLIIPVFGDLILKSELV